MNEKLIHIIQDRKVTEAQIESHKIAYDPGTQAVRFPIHNEYGKYVGCVDYYADRNPKYIKNFKQTDRPLFYNANNLKNVFYGKPLFVTEGVFDTLTLESLGFNAVGVMGATLNKKALDILTRYTDKIILALDNDTAGFLATEKIIKENPDLKLYKFRVQGGKDANDVIRTDPEGLKRQLTEFIERLTLSSRTQAEQSRTCDPALRMGRS